MTTIWDALSMRVRTCPSCGARYTVMDVRAKERTQAIANCVICNSALSEWQTDSQFVYTFLEAPNLHKR